MVYLERVHQLEKSEIGFFCCEGTLQKSFALLSGSHSSIQNQLAKLYNIAICHLLNVLFEVCHHLVRLLRAEASSTGADVTVNTIQHKKGLHAVRAIFIRRQVINQDLLDFISDFEVSWQSCACLNDLPDALFL